MKWKMVGSCLRNHWVILIIIVVCIPVSGSFRAWGSSYFQELVDHVSSVGMEGVGSLIALTAGIHLIHYFTRFLNAYMSVRLKNYMVQDLRMKLSEHLLKIPYEQYEQEQNGNLQSIMKNDVKTAANLIFILFVGIGSTVFSAFFSILFLAKINMEMALLILMVTIGFGLWNRKILKKIKRNEKEIRKGQGRLTSFVTNTYDTADSIILYEKEAYMEKKFWKYRHPYETSFVNIKKIDSVRMGFYTIVNHITRFGSVIYLSFLSLEGRGSIGGVLAFIILSHVAMSSVEQIFEWTSTYMESDSAWDRINEVLQLSEIEGNERENRKKICEHYEVRGFSYAYEDNTVFSDLTLHFEKGNLYGISGESGSGKSTLLKCLMGIYRAKGQMFLNGREVSPEEIKEQFAYVPSDCQLFTGTLYENISMGNPDITKRQCMEWAEKLNLLQWMSGLEDGLDEKVKEGGNNFSGGQRQMVCVLRAFLADKPILVMDEPFSALDGDRTDALKRVLQKEKEKRMIILTSHRKNTLEICDSIYALSDNSQYKT